MKKLLILFLLAGCSSVPQKQPKTLTRAPQEARTPSQTEAVTVNVPVKLQWNPNPSEDHAKYEVYEVNPSFGTTKAYWKKLATVDSPNYVANWPSRSLHVCAVKAINPFQSPFSVPVIVQVP